MTHSDYEDDWSGDDEFDEPLDDDDSAELVACPECGTDVYEEAEQCPVCGAYITHSTSAWQGRPIWWIVLGLIGIVVTSLLLALP